MPKLKGPQTQTITVSEKHIKARIAAFILAFVVALAAFVNGFLSLGNTKEGYYDLLAAGDADAPYYAAGITYTCLFEGSRGEVRSAVREADDAYSRALSWAYKLCDAENEYDGYINMATINRVLREQSVARMIAMTGSSVHPEGQGVSFGTGSADADAGGAALSGVSLSEDGRRVSFELAPELYSALRYAYRWTGLDAGYNVFAGPVFGEWKDIIYAEDPLAFDPALNAAEAERLGALAAVTADRAAFNMTFDDASCSVSIALPVETYAALAGLESEAPLIDFGALKNAFMLEMMLSRIDLSGPMGKGLITASEGLQIDLRDYTVRIELDRRQGAAEDGSAGSSPGNGAGGGPSDSGPSENDPGKLLRRDLFFDEYTGAPGEFVAEYSAQWDRENAFDLSKHQIAQMALIFLTDVSAEDEETISARREALRALPGLGAKSSIIMEYAQ